VRKIGAPGHEELGLGAVVDGHDPQLVLNEDLVRAGAPPAGYIETQERRGAVTRQAAQRWLDCGAGRIPSSTTMTVRPSTAMGERSLA